MAGESGIAIVAMPLSPAIPPPLHPAKQMDCKGSAFAGGPGGKASWRGSGAEPLALSTGPTQRMCDAPLPDIGGQQFVQAHSKAAIPNLVLAQHHCQ